MDTGRIQAEGIGKAPWCQPGVINTCKVKWESRRYKMCLWACWEGRDWAWIYFKIKETLDHHKIITSTDEEENIEVADLSKQRKKGKIQAAKNLYVDPLLQCFPSRTLLPFLIRIHFLTLLNQFRSTRDSKSTQYPNRKNYPPIYLYNKFLTSLSSHLSLSLSISLPPPLSFPPSLIPPPCVLSIPPFLFPFFFLLNTAYFDRKIHRWLEQFSFSNSSFDLGSQNTPTGTQRHLYKAARS